MQKMSISQLSVKNVQAVEYVIREKMFLKDIVVIVLFYFVVHVKNIENQKEKENE
jgi:hypothetical protein